MSKNDTQQPKDKPEQEAPQHTQSYFFPNVGDGPAFSVEAASYEEAVEANQKHLKETK